MTFVKIAKPNDRVGNYMHTASGGKYYPFDPRPEEVDIETIAHHLATRGRFNGATQHRLYPERIHYSVAEHSVYVARYVEKELNRPDLALCALLHDASEAYNGDLIRPLKYSKEFAEPFQRIEELNERAVAERFNIQFPYPPEIKIADNAVGLAELLTIVPRDEQEEWITMFNDDLVAANIDIDMFDPYFAKQMFLMEYERLTQDAK